MATPIHCCRVEDELWQAAQAKAANEGRTMTDVVVKALEAYVGDES